MMDLVTSQSSMSTIAAEAAMAAAAHLKRRKNNSGRAYASSRSDEERLRKRSRKMAKDFQDAMQKSVKRKLDSMSGSQDNRKVGLKVAQFIPGKGLEVSGAQVDTDPTVYCSLGLKNEKLVDPLEETFDRIKGRKISMDFAFKLVNDTSDLLAQQKDTRVTTFNCFRHVNPDSFNYVKTGWTADVSTDDSTDHPLSDANYAWHTTLGPDAAPVRRATGGLTGMKTQAGVWRGLENAQPSTHVGGLAEILAGGGGQPDTGDADKANSLMSPYRYPKDMEIMYSRVNRQLMENYGWMLNPFKFTSFSRNASFAGITTDGSPQRTSLELWSNPDEYTLDFKEIPTSAIENNKKWSYPANINHKIGQNLFDPKGFDWHSQFGPGKLNYQFQNDGTNPVCIDICVVGVKKNSPVPVDLLQHFCEYNYQISKLANIGDTNLNGFQTSSTGTVDTTIGNQEWHKNAKLPFMPDECFKNPQSYLQATGYASLLGGDKEHLIEAFNQGKLNPFKVIKRDQFIVSSGASRAWNTTLPSIKYRPQLYEDASYPLDSGMTDTQERSIVTTADEYTFILCIGASGLPRPVEEIYPSVKNLALSGDPNNQMVDAKAIIDRQPSTCNVSVLGTYTETIQPTFPKDVSSVNFINGRLTEPYFTEQPGKISAVENPHKVNPNRINTVDIAQMGQIVHTSDTGVVGVGAITTEIGA